MSSDFPTPKRRDKHAIVSFGLAVFLLVLPVMADIAIGLMFAKIYWAVAIWMASCYGLVAVFWISSLHRHWKEPGIWNGRGYLVATGVILGLHAVMLAASAVDWWTRVES